MHPPEVLAIGRISVDLYSVEADAGFDVQQTFTKSIGGSPTNVAVAAARLGRRSAIVTKVGDDALGAYARARLKGFGVLTDFVGTQPGGQTPLALAALAPPETPQVLFYRGSAAPDTQLVPTDLRDDVVREAPLLWMSFSALAQGSTAETCRNWLRERNRATHTVLDLDYRPALWTDIGAARAAASAAIDLATVVVGNREECDMALGTSDPDAAVDALLGRGVDLAIVKLGGDGAYLADRTGRVQVAPTRVDVVCGLGAGDAFGAALAHGLLSGWDRAAIGEFASAAGAYVAARLTCADDMPAEADVRALMEATR